MKTMIAATLLLSFSAASALAEGNGEPFANYVANYATTGQYVRDTGSQAYTAQLQPIALPGNNDVLPQNGSQSIVQSVNSLPVGFEDGTVAYVQARSVRQWVSAHQNAPARVASR